MANHASTRTTQLYDRRAEEVTLDEVERILVSRPPRTCGQSAWESARSCTVACCTIQRALVKEMITAREERLFAERDKEARRLAGPEREVNPQIALLLGLGVLCC